MVYGGKRVARARRDLVHIGRHPIGLAALAIQAAEARVN